MTITTSPRCFKRLKTAACSIRFPTRSFDEKFPPDRQQDYTIAMSDDGDIGIFYDNMFMYYKGQYHEISRDDVPLDWFRRYDIFTEADF